MAVLKNVTAKWWH